MNEVEADEITGCQNLCMIMEEIGRSLTKEELDAGICADLELEAVCIEYYVGGWDEDKSSNS